MKGSYLFATTLKEWPIDRLTLRDILKRVRSAAISQALLLCFMKTLKRGGNVYGAIPLNKDDRERPIDIEIY